MMSYQSLFYKYFYIKNKTSRTYILFSLLIKSIRFIATWYTKRYSILFSSFRTIYARVGSMPELITLSYVHEIEKKQSRSYTNYSMENTNYTKLVADEYAQLTVFLLWFMWLLTDIVIFSTYWFVFSLFNYE